MPEIIYKDKVFCVYHYLRPKDSETAKAGTPYYVGKGKGRARAYADHGHIHVPKDRNMIVFPAENMYEDDAFALEISDIKLYGRKDLGTGILHNRTDGGDGASGRKHTQETKDKIGDSNRGKIQSQEAIEKSAATIRGRNWYYNPETNKSITRFPDNVPDGFIPGRGRSPEQIEKLAAFHRGRTRPQETGDKISKKKTGMKQSPEHIKNAAATLKGKKHFYNPVTKKAIRCLPDNVPDGFIPGRRRKS